LRRIRREGGGVGSRKDVGQRREEEGVSIASNNTYGGKRFLILIINMPGTIFMMPCMISSIQL